MISKEKLRQRIAPQKPKPDATFAELQMIRWRVDHLLAEVHNGGEPGRIVRSLAQHLGLRNY